MSRTGREVRVRCYPAGAVSVDAEWLRTGALVHRETVFEGLASAPHALAEMIAGHTTGKTLVRTT